MFSPCWRCAQRRTKREERSCPGPTGLQLKWDQTVRPWRQRLSWCPGYSLTALGLKGRGLVAKGCSGVKGGEERPRRVGIGGDGSGSGPGGCSHRSSPASVSRELGWRWPGELGLGRLKAAADPRENPPVPPGAVRPLLVHFAPRAVTAVQEAPGMVGHAPGQRGSHSQALCS